MRGEVIVKAVGKKRPKLKMRKVGVLLAVVMFIQLYRF